MTIEVTYNVTDIYISSEVSPIYIDVNYQTSGGGAAVWGGITGTLSNQTDLQTALNGKFDDPTGTTLQYIDGTGGLQTFPLTLPVLQEVRNLTGATLTAGTVVYISGATGNKPTVSKAIATGDNTSAQTLGMIQSAIANNGTGYVVVIGTCSGLDTSAYTEGQQLYLSYTTAGEVTTTKPYAPNHLVYVGIVTRSHPTLGTIEVRVQNGYEMDELHNVDAYNPTNNDGLFYNTTTSLWEHKSIGTVLGYNPEQPLTFTSPLSRLVNAVSIPAATSSVNGYLSSTDWSTFNGKENALAFSSPLTRSTNTISIPQATSSVSGYLSSTDWSTFNSKQGALTLTTTGTSGAATLVGNTLNIPQYSGAGGMAIGGSITSATAGSVLFAGTSGVLAQDNSNLFWDDANDRLGIRTSSPNASLHVSGSTTASGAIARGANYTPTLVAAANNDVLVGLDVNPTFTNGAFTGVVNIPLRIGTSSTTPFGGPLIFMGRDQNAESNFQISNSTSGTSATVGFRIFGANGRSSQIFEFSALHSNTEFASHLVIEPNSPTAKHGLILSLPESTSGSDLMVYTNGRTATNRRLTLFNSSGNLLLQSGGTHTDAGFRLDVSGTARVQGTLATTDFITNTKNVDGTNKIEVINTNSGTSSETFFNAISDAASGQIRFGKYSSTHTTYKTLVAKDSFIYNSSTGGDISLLNDFATGNIKFAAGGSSSAHMTIKSNGRINMSSLPTSSAGLSAGDLWNNLGIINIV